jgi:hypothetical protein
VDGDVRLVRGGVRSAPPAGEGRWLLPAVWAGAGQTAVVDEVNVAGSFCHIAVPVAMTLAGAEVSR